MFIISELGALAKIIVSFVGYLLFLPVNLLDTFVFSKLFEGEFISTSVSFVILLFLLFLILGTASKILFLFLKFGVTIFILYLLSDTFAGLFLIVVLIYLVKKYLYFKKSYNSDCEET